MRHVLAFCLLLPVAASAADSRCRDESRAEHFSKKALPDKSDAERFRAFVEACATDDVVALTSKLIAFPTVSAERPKADKAFAAMGAFLERWARERGFTFRSVGNHDVFEIGWGQGDGVLGLLFHGDVVPAVPREWKRKPFVAKVEKRKLYGRGAEDDKGPLAAGLVAIALAKELGVSPRGRVLVISGNGEEHDWGPMTQYAQSAQNPAHVISVDSGYPVVVAQSGFVRWSLEAEAAEPAKDARGMAAIVSISAGEFLTQVPGEATMELAPRGVAVGSLAEKVKTEVNELKAHRPELAVTVEVKNGRVRVTARGKPVHSSVAEQGHNALWDLAAVAHRLPLAKNGASAMLDVVAMRFDGDFWGQKLGVAYEDELMGRLLVAPTVLRQKDGKVRLDVNMRRPRGKSQADFLKSLEKAGAEISALSEGLVKAGGEPYVGEPHVADTSGPLVTTLMDIWRRHGGAEAKPVAIRGGTYARLFSGAVDFGPSFPGQPYTGHAPDEYVEIESLQKTTRLLAEAVWRLAVEAPKTAPTSTGSRP